MPRSNTIANRACDACRLRKIKCEPSSVGLGTGESCKACRISSLPCDYNLPVKRRGPVAKRRDTQIASPSSAISSYNSTTAPPGPYFSHDILQAPEIGGIADTELDSLKPHLIDFYSQDVVDAMLDDYLEIIYPSMPVVHRPTFAAHRLAARHHHDKVYLVFVLAICATVVSIVPMNLHKYRLINSDFGFTTPRDMVDRMHRLIGLVKTPDYYDHLSYEKWAIAYLMAASYGHSGLVNRARLALAEAEEILLTLGFHQKRFYDNLDNIQAQLYRKAFWLMFTSYAQLRPSEIGWDTLNDRCAFQTVDAELLIPVEVDDEFITSRSITAQPMNTTSLVVAFNALRRVENCLVSIIRDPSVPILATSHVTSHDDTHPSDILGGCECGRAIRMASSEDVLIARLRQVKYVLDYLPPELSPWPKRRPETESPMSVELHFEQNEIMRANIHVTHLWAQNMLLDRLEFLQRQDLDRGRASKTSLEQTWDTREEICRQLLHLLGAISKDHLDANGAPLAYKVRQVVSSLLECPFGEEHHVSSRAKMYVREFTDILSGLAAWSDFIVSNGLR